MLPLDCWFMVMLFAGFTLGVILTGGTLALLERKLEHARHVIKDLENEVKYLQGRLDKAKQANP